VFLSALRIRASVVSASRARRLRWRRAAAITLARTAAEAVRDLNHATRDHAGLEEPSAAYDVLGALSQAASALPQTAAQITSYLDQALAAGKIGHDDGQDPALSVDSAVIFLEDARRSAAALAGDLDAAQQQLALINGRGHRTPQDQP
jgi:hypothetical protein